ncbi:NAD-dependent DNA ligase LigA [Marinobacter sp. HL-58]|uniref:NAD-dependent DNA ligase LigA n=1 Tax=Marinobacter sp. HL-58 TaxID=1479237 RepID=UPI00068A0861|nr:NAD-dependent DNA ligase LigA [Marinobacter sp. HL-58]KPP98879.1 MAG: NAD-dependent DNA ligase [Marinobacter sp. HL-58]
MDFRSKPDTNFRNIDDLTEKEAAEEARALRDGINYHDHLYYVKNAPKISDAVYDQLFQRLEDLEAAFPDLKTEDSPTVRIGAEPVSKLTKIRHAAPLLSLQATLECKAVESFLRTARDKSGTTSVRYCLEPKFDGLSVEVVYHDGRFKHGSTRGDGMVGEDISHNLKTIRSLPLCLQEADGASGRVAVRAEVYMSREGFVALNRQRVERGQDTFANPRNAAAGMMRQLESRNVAGKPFDIVFYEILAADSQLPPTHCEVLDQLSRWGLRVSPLNDSGSSLEDIRAFHQDLAKRRDVLDYEIDGIVVKVDDHGLRDELGNRHRNPRWAIAWKFEPCEEVTTVADIVVQVGRTGILTPVALLQPVDVGGVTVSRATLHNANEVRRKDIRVGDCVRVIRAGDVIPEIEKRIGQKGSKRAAPFSMPRRCPACGSKVQRKGAYYLCNAGLSCPAQLVTRLQHFASRDAMDIKHLGEHTAAQLVERGLVHDLADLYGLTVEDLESLDGFAERSAKQLHDAIQGAKKPPLDRFLYALGIRHVGQRVARQLANEYGALESLAAAGQQDIGNIPDIGKETAESVADFFADHQNRDVLNRLYKAGMDVQPMPGKHRQP